MTNFPSNSHTLNQSNNPPERAQDLFDLVSALALNEEYLLPPLVRDSGQMATKAF
jgi:hypothetical protein